MKLWKNILNKYIETKVINYESIIILHYNIPSKNDDSIFNINMKTKIRDFNEVIYNEQVIECISLFLSVKLQNCNS